MPVIVDGHNLIGKMSSVSLADPDDEEKLVKLLLRHLRHGKQKAIVVFDKGCERDLMPSQMGSRLRVIFAPPGSSADAVIIDMIKKDPNPKGLTIVSSDNEIRRCARSRRARLMFAEDLARELESEPKPHHKHMIGKEKPERIDVAEWADFFRKGRT